jgi:tRNA dimethylallyltransferase
MPVSSKTMIVIAGPTASGKTALAIEVAKHFQTEIISADSRQCYKELNIGVARPTPAELEAVPHYFIGSHSIHEEVTASLFEQHAIEKAADLFDEHDVAVMVGGTGLYIKAFCEGLDAIPPIAAAIRKKVIEEYEKSGLAWLRQQVREKDPDFFMRGEIQNPQRLMRALEVKEATGKSILSFHKGEKAHRSFNILKFAIDIPRQELYRRINARTDQMIQAGLLDEAKKLLAYSHLGALQTVGYSELFDHFLGKSDLATAVELIKQHTRNYAKRQITWFKKDKDFIWIPPDPHHVIDRYRV